MTEKFPAFQLYADDFLAGTSDMTLEEVGIYIRLLCHQWNKGGLPNDFERICRSAGVVTPRGECEPNANQMRTDSEAAVRWVLENKFVLGPDGIYRNVRMESVRSNLIDWQAKSREGGQRSAAKRVKDSEWGKQMAARRFGSEPNANHDANQMRTTNEPPCEPNANTPSPSPSNTHTHTESGNAAQPTLEEVLTYADMHGITKESATNFFNHHEGNNLWINQHNRLIGWQVKLKHWQERDRKTAATQAQAEPHPNGSKPQQKPRAPFLSELKAVLEAKKQQLDRIRNRGHEDALGWKARDEADRAEYKRLKQEIYDLNNRIANYQL